MLIESLIKRLGGSFVDLGGTEYHFKPVGDDGTGAHVADVTDDSHAAVLLTIPQYRPYGKDAQAPEEPAPVKDAETGEGAESTGEGDDETPADLATASDDDLRVIFEKEVGRKPSPRAQRDTLIAQITTARSGA